MSARFRPTEIEESKGSYLGLIPVNITNFEDRTDEFKWADGFYEVTLKSDNSQYPYTMKVLGSHDREPSGHIKTSSFLKRLYSFFDAVNFEGGPDTEGNMVDGNGEKIESMEKFFHDSILPNVKSKQFFAYAYKEMGKDGKVYTVVYPKLSDSMEDLDGYIKFIKSKGVIKEVESNGVVGGNSNNSNQSTNAF